MAKAKEQTITIDGKEYKESELSKEVIENLQSLQFCDSEIKRLNAQLAVTATASNGYKKAISELLAK